MCEFQTWKWCFFIPKYIVITDLLHVWPLLSDCIHWVEMPALANLFIYRCHFNPPSLLVSCIYAELIISTFSPKGKEKITVQIEWFALNLSIIHSCKDGWKMEKQGKKLNTYIRTYITQTHIIQLIPFIVDCLVLELSFRVEFN